MKYTDRAAKRRMLHHDVPTRLSHVDLGEADIDGLIEKLTQHGMVSLGEHDAITPDVSREILIAAL